MRLKVVGAKQYQKVTCVYGFRCENEKKVWVDVTDKEYITTKMYSFKEPVSCEVCNDAVGDCEVCINEG